MKDAARNTVLGAIRQHLAEARRTEGLPTTATQRSPLPTTDSLDREALIAQFAQRLGVVGGVAWRVADVAGAAACIDQLCIERGVRRIAISELNLHLSDRSILLTLFEIGVVAIVHSKVIERSVARELFV